MQTFYVVFQAGPSLFAKVPVYRKELMHCVTNNYFKILVSKKPYFNRKMSRQQTILRPLVKVRLESPALEQRSYRVLVAVDKCTK